MKAQRSKPRSYRPPSIRAALARIVTARFTSLFLVLVVICATAPYLHEGVIHEAFVELLFSALIVLAIWSAGRGLHLVTALLAIPALGGRWLLPFTDSTAVLLAVRAADLVFVLFITVVILSVVLRHEDVTIDTISGALAAYFLLGLTWGVAYGIVELLDPGAFAVPAALGSEYATEPASGAILIYFSLVTLSSVGYGDITPVSAAARSLSSLEGLAGQLFLAVLVARLVGIHSARPKQS